jgi:hypothetical protein
MHTDILKGCPFVVLAVSSASTMQHKQTTHCCIAFKRFAPQRNAAFFSGRNPNERTKNGYPQNDQQKQQTTIDGPGTWRQPQVRVNQTQAA